MVHVPAMTQLVYQQVAHDFGALKHEADVQADCPVGRAAAPTGPLPAQLDLAVIDARLERKRHKKRRQMLRRALTEPGEHRGAYLPPVTWIGHADPDLTWRGLGNVASTTLFVADGPASTQCRELDLRRSHLGIFGRLQRELPRATFSPVAMTRHKALDGRYADAGRHHDLDTPARENAHRQPSGPATDADVPARLRAACRQQRELQRGHSRARGAGPALSHPLMLPRSRQPPGSSPVDFGS